MLLHTSFLPLEVLTRIQIVAFINCVMVVWVDSSTMDFDRGDYVVGHGIAVAGVLNHCHDSVAVEISLVYIPLLFLLRDHLVVIVVWHLVLRKVSASRISSHCLNIIIVTMGRRGLDDVRKAQITRGLLVMLL
jgi:hypothetical protein